MAQDFAAKKLTALQALVARAPIVEALARDNAELVSYFTDNGFLTGGANPISDADAQAAYPWLTAALVNSAVSTAINSVSLSTGNRTTLRQVANLPNP